MEGNSVEESSGGLRVLILTFKNFTIFIGLFTPLFILAFFSFVVGKSLKMVHNNTDIDGVEVVENYEETCSVVVNTLAITTWFYPLASFGMSIFRQSESLWFYMVRVLFILLLLLFSHYAVSEIEKTNNLLLRKESKKVRITFMILNTLCLVVVISITARTQKENGANSTVQSTLLI